MWPFLSAFIFAAAWCIFARKLRKMCCSLLQWCDVSTVVWCRTCTVCFFRSLLRLFLSFPPILGVQNESTVKSGIFLHGRFETHFFLYLVEYSVKNFNTTRQYLVNVTCNCWFRMCTQFHQKLVKVHVFCTVQWCCENILLTEREWRSYRFFSGSNFCPESYVRRHVCHTTVVVMCVKH